MTDYDFASLSKKDLNLRRQQLAMVLAPELPFSAEGYREHYIGIFGWQLPPHGWDWMQEFFEAYNNGWRRFLVKAFRGATKSTIFTIGFGSYWLTKFENDAVMIVQKGDVPANKTSSAVASIIKDNAAWRQMYPDLVPDEPQGWGFNGYEVKNKSIDYGDWRREVLRLRPKDPSLVAYGWSSGSIVGSHPHLLLIDDIHDEENTASEREVDRVIRTLKGNILQTLNRPPDLEEDGDWKEPTAIVSYTPWYPYDAYAYLESTGLYYQIETPLIEPARQGEDGAFQWRQKYWVMPWNIKEPQKYLDDKVQEYGEQDFARMQLLNLKAAEGLNLKREWLHEFPVDQIDPSWPVYFGVDYASTADKIRPGQDPDYFALAIGRGIPGGGVVIVDGIQLRLSQADSEKKVKALASLYPQLETIGFEKLGKGYDAMWSLISSGLPIIPCPMEGERLRPKGERFEKIMAPMFQFSRVWISSAKTPFLKAFTDEWVGWPGKHDDTLDAVYWLLYVAQGHTLIPDQKTQDLLGGHRSRKLSPFAQGPRDINEDSYYAEN